MWIRSQDKTILVKIESIYIDNLDTSKKIWGIKDSSKYNLGEYKTKKRALEILELVQNHIETLDYNKMLINQPEEQYNYESYVFEMPKE